MLGGGLCEPAFPLSYIVLCCGGIGGGGGGVRVSLKKWESQILFFMQK